MPDIRPFRGITFNPAKTGSTAAVVAEPYDKVTEAMRAAYLKTSPYNVVRVDLPREELDGRDRYATAAGVFRGWLAKGIVERAERPAIYLYEQGFELPGAAPAAGGRFLRRAFVGLVEAREHARGHVLPHERTFREPKADRMALLEAVRAHFGMVFLLYEDKEREVERALAVADTPISEPVFDFKLADGTSHRLFPITNEAAISGVRRALAGRTCTIADGHHRYETAIAFRREHERRGDMRPGHAYRTAAFVDVDDPGLRILPTHRLLPRGITVDRVIRAAEPWCATMPLSGPTVTPAFRVTDAEGRSTPLAVVRADEVDRALADLPEPIRRLEVTVLHRLILERGLALEAGSKESTLGYVRSRDEGMDKLKSGAFGCMVELPAVSPRSVIAVAEAGAVMPQKSTDFYPKLLSGLVMNDIEDDLHG